MTRTLIALALVAAATAVHARLASLEAQRAPAGPAFFVRGLDNPADRREAQPQILDSPILPGSIAKLFTLVAALESHVIEPDTSRVCRRAVTVDGRRYVCSHPDLKRALSPAEALAHSCNDFFVSLATRLSRGALNDVRARVGLPPVAASANFAAALVGLDGPRLTPRALLDAVMRVTGHDRDRPLPLGDDVRRVVRDGMRGAAEYGTASALKARGVSALAKTGTAPMPGGASMGLLVGLMPATNPTHGIVVVAPGAAGLDAASIAADVMINDAQTIRIGITAPNGSVRATPLDLEEYIARVLAGEGQPQAADGAQQALAITARTFALANRNRHRREGYDLCDTTHCQVIRPATAVTRRAAQATAGRVLVHQGQPAMVFYSAWCGGRTELASEVWPGALNYAFEPSQRDDACRDESGWTSDLRAGDIERALRAAGLRGDRLRDLRVMQRNASGRVARLRADGFTPPEISGHDFRMAVGRVAGWQSVKSTAFDLRRTGAGYQLTGRGFGHGVGLCVVGAGVRAARGDDAEAILKFYFPGLRVETYRSDRRLTAAPTTRDEVQIALPAAEESERARVVQLIRGARDDIARRAGVSVPPAIRVTVHPTVDSFGRATGQPWWVSAATDGTAIDLLPLTMLRQQGQLERTIRHEVAHLLLDATLARRPLWVREGAAFYFADPSARSAIAGRAECPSDEEFLRPMSAGAHRSAYARAEACFRREIARGRKWSEVR